MQRVSITESRAGIARLGKTVWTFRTYPDGESVENTRTEVGDRLFPVAPQASPLKPAPGFSPEGGTSLPLVRKPPESGNKTTILYSSDAPASISDTSQCDIYLI